MSAARALARGRDALLTAVVVAPIALSAQNIIGWAADRAGLGLQGPWPYVVFFALDAAAGVCVMMTLILASQGERPGAFGVLVWVFALASAFAGYRHGTQAAAPRDAWWFFPLMSVLGPALLHLVLGHVRRAAQHGDRRRLAYASASAYRLGRWLPGVGAFAETYCAWRVGRLEGITTPADAIDRYRVLCPQGQWRVLRAMRAESAVKRAATAVPDRPADEPARTEPVDGAGAEPARPAPKAKRATASRRARRAGWVASSNRHGDELARRRAGSGWHADLARLAEEFDTVPGRNKIAEFLGISTRQADKLVAVIETTGVWPVPVPAEEQEKTA